MNDGAALFTCLYCGYPKPQEESTLEHAIPRALGGAHGPDRYKLRNICKKCNNDLGSFVDASFAKSWFVTNALAMAAHKLYDGMNEVPLPLTCLGPIDVADLQIPSDYVAESWVGPSGEFMVWVRPKDEQLYWYVGGNPRHRAVPSTAYWFPTSDNLVRWKIGADSLIAAFKERKNARKVIGVPYDQLPPGFDAPNTLDIANIAAIRAGVGGFCGRASFNLEFDYRFAAKLGLGVGYSLFGEAFVSTEHAAELRKGCWPGKHSEILIRGVPMFGVQVPLVGSVASYPGAVVLTVMPAGDSYAMTITIDEGRPIVVALAPTDISCSGLDTFEAYALLLFPSLRQHVETTLAKLIGHRNKLWEVPELTAIDERLVRAERFWGALPPLPSRSI